MTGLSEQLLVQTEELLELEKGDMKEQLDTAKHNKEVLKDIEDVIESEKVLIEIFQSHLNDHIQSKEKDEQGLIENKQDLIRHRAELKQCLIDIEKDEVKNDRFELARKKQTIDRLQKMIKLDKEQITCYRKSPKIRRDAIKACKSLIKRHTKRLERLTKLRDNIQHSIDYQIGDAEISRQNIAKYEAEIERYKREIEEDRKEL